MIHVEMDRTGVVVPRLSPIVHRMRGSEDVFLRFFYWVPHLEIWIRRNVFEYDGYLKMWSWREL